MVIISGEEHELKDIKKALLGYMNSIDDALGCEPGCAERINGMIQIGLVKIAIEKQLKKISNGLILLKNLSAAPIIKLSQLKLPN